MILFRSLTVAILTFATAPALADDTSNSCQMGGIAYSVGAGLAQGNDQTLTCSASGSWMPDAAGVASGCVHNGNHYGIGAFVTISLDSALSMTCRADGIWRRYEAK
jgi:hypothetical protein